MTAARIPQDLPSVEYLRECLAYDPETGVLTWKERPREHFKGDGAHRSFLSHRSGKPTGSLSRKGYLVVILNGSMFQAHRIAWAIYYGSWPEQHIDHINLVRSDNRIVNLRDVSNAANRLRQVRHSDNTSGFTGVSWHSRKGKWNASIRLRGKDYYLGLYSEIADAIEARKAANLNFGFAENHGQIAPCVVPSAKPGRVRKNNTSGYLGVGWHKMSGRWEAHIGINGKSLMLGTFETKEEAIAARKAAEIKYGVADRVSYGSGPAILQDPIT